MNLQLLLGLDEREARLLHGDLLQVHRVLRGGGIQLYQQVARFHVAALRDDADDARGAFHFTANAHFIHGFERAALDDGDEKVAPLNLIRTVSHGRRAGAREKKNQPRQHQRADDGEEERTLFHQPDDGRGHAAIIHVSC